MSSLFGVCGVSQPAAVLGSMGSAFKYGKAKLDVKAGLGLVHLPGFGNKVAWNRAKSVCVLVSGDLYTDSHVSDPSKLVLEAYLKSGVDCVRALNGVFSIAIVDKRTKTVHCIQDRFGVIPLYYAAIGKQLIFASELKAVMASAKVPLEMDWRACRDLFDYGSLVNDYTLVKGVHLLDGATIMTFKTGALSFRRYWSPTEIVIDRKSTQEEFVERGVAVIKEVMKRQTADLDEAIVFLSGGFDSRCICAATKGLPIKISTYTTVHPAGRIERQYAAEVAAHLGLRNTFVDVPDNNFKSIEEYARMLDSEYAEHLWILPLLQHFKKPMVEFDGLSGDWLLRGPLEEQALALCRRHGYTTEQWMHNLAVSLKDGPHSDWHAAEPLVSDEVRKLWSSQPSSFDELIKSIPKVDRQLTLTGMAIRIHRVTSFMSQMLINRRLQCRFPFLDNAVIDFGLSIPLQSKIAKRAMYSKIIDRLSPGIMSLPSTNTYNAKAKLRYSLWLATIRYTPSLLRQWHKRRYAQERHAPLSRANEPLVAYYSALARTLPYPPGFNNAGLEAELARHAKQHTDPRAILVPSLLLGLWWREANGLVKKKR